MYINSLQVSDFIISCLYQVTGGHNQKKEFSQVGPNSFVLLLCRLKWEKNIQQTEFSLNLKVVSYNLKENEYTWKIFLCIFIMGTSFTTSGSLSCTSSPSWMGSTLKVERWTQQTWNAKMSLTEWHPLHLYIFPLSLRLYHFLFIPGHQIFCTDNEKVSFSVVTSTDLFRVCRGYFRSPERSFILCCWQRMYVSSTVRDFQMYSFFLTYAFNKIMLLVISFFSLKSVKHVSAWHTNNRSPMLPQRMGMQWDGARQT